MTVRVGRHTKAQVVPPMQDRAALVTRVAEGQETMVRVARPIRVQVDPGTAVQAVLLIPAQAARLIPARAGRATQDPEGPAIPDQAH
jgi:hypothetical protein